MYPYYLYIKIKYYAKTVLTIKFYEIKLNKSIHQSSII